MMMINSLVVCGLVAGVGVGVPAVLRDELAAAREGQIYNQYPVKFFKIVYVATPDVLRDGLAATRVRHI